MAKRRTRSHTRTTSTTRPKSRLRARTKPARARPRPKADLQARVFRVFARQADSLWSGFADQCRQFADGFNTQFGAPELTIEADATTLRAAYPKGDAELVVTLDKGERYVQCWINCGCDTHGNCSTNQQPVGMTVRGDVLHFAYGGDVVSDERLAIQLLTQLTNGNTEPE